MMTKPFSEYDARHYTTMDVMTGYNTWAHTYEQTVDTQLDLPLLVNLASVPWHTIQTVVDLGCGTGRIGMWLHNQGISHLHGVDCSPEMLQRARTKLVYEQLCNADITHCPLPSQAYDLGITVLAACHLPNLHALYTEAARLIKPGGFFVLLDFHPFFLLQGIPTNFDSAWGKPIAIENFVHFISDHVNLGRHVNWTLLEMQERLVDAEWIALRPGMARYVNQPASFVMVWWSEA